MIRSTIKLDVWWKLFLTVVNVSNVARDWYYKNRAFVPTSDPTNDFISASRHRNNVCPPRLLVTAIPALTESPILLHLWHKKIQYFIEGNESSVVDLLPQRKWTSNRTFLCFGVNRVCRYGVKVFTLFYFFTLFRYWRVM